MKPSEIQDAVQILLKVYTELDASDYQIFTEKQEARFTGALVSLASPDAFPPSEQYLIPAVAAVADAWDGVQRLESGSVDRNGIPAGPWIRAMESLKNALEEGPPRTGIEPVRDLLKSMAKFDGKYDQIARMYGKYDGDNDSYSGFFFGPTGKVVPALIEQEAKNPGSVVPPGWDPKQEHRLQSLAADLKRLQGHYGYFKSLHCQLTGTKVDIDKASVEEMLLEGQFPDVIARVKGVSETFVRSEAARLGIVLKTQDEILSEAAAEMWEDDRQRNDGAYLRAMGEAPDLSSDLADIDSFDSQGVEPAEDPAASDNADESENGSDDVSETNDNEESDMSELEPTAEELKQLVIQALEKDPHMKASQLKKELDGRGVKASPISIGRLLANYRPANAR